MQTQQTQWQTLQTEQDYDRALARLWEIFDSEPGTPEDAEHDLLVELILAYEDIHYPMDDPTPLAALEFRMDQALMTIDDLLPALGSREQAAAILAGQQEITPQIANALHQKLNIDLRDLLPHPAQL